MGGESDLLKWAIQIGGPMAGLFLIGGYFYRKDMRFYIAEMQDARDDWREQSLQWMQIVKENTSAFAHNTAVVQSLHQHIADGERRQSARENR